MALNVDKMMPGQSYALVDFEWCRRWIGYVKVPYDEDHDPTPPVLLA